MTASLGRSGALGDVVFMLKSGISWEMLHLEMGCGSRVTCWRRSREWHEARVWECLHEILLDRFGEADTVDSERVSLGSASITAKGVAKNPDESNG
jgi:transposase